MCLGLVPYHTEALAPEQLGKVHSSWKGSLSLLHLWVTAQGTAQLAHHGSEQAAAVTEALGGHTEVLLDMLLFPVPVSSPPFVQGTS